MSMLNHFTAIIRICVDGVEGERLLGRVFSRRLTKPVLFSDIGSLLLQIDAVLDAQNFPQAFQRTRTFTQNVAAVPAAPSLEEGMAAEEVAEARGEVATFDISVLTRRNTTWQGTLDWLDGTEPESFSSVLDLIKCADRHILHSTTTK